MKKHVWFTMRNAVALALMAQALLVGAPGVALAASCQALAAQVASSQGGVVLSVSSKGDKCQIKILIKSKNGPPKRKTVVVSK